MGGRGTGPLGASILELIFPGRCLICGEWLFGKASDAAPVCADCRARIVVPGREAVCQTCGTRLISEIDMCRRCRGSDFAFSSNTALFPNEGAVKDLIHHLKFENRTRLAPLFAQWAAAALAERHPGARVIPVPSRPGRATPDAVELTARCLEKSHGVTVERLLRRAPGVAQKTLDFQQRRENLKGRIQLVAGAQKKLGSEAVVLDDVFTTGATLDACARALREAGMERVFGMTLVIEE